MYGKREKKSRKSSQARSQPQLPGYVGLYDSKFFPIEIMMQKRIAGFLISDLFFANWGDRDLRGFDHRCGYNFNESV